MDLALVRRLEELSLNALPALQTQVYDGWILRFASGYTRRANSINPLYPSTLPLAQKIAECEERYAGERQGIVFKLTPAAEPAGLDTALAALGYAGEAHTSVQTLDLEHLEDHPGSAEVLESLAPRWLEPFCAMSRVPPGDQATLERMLAGIRARTGYLLLSRNDTPVACGVGVAEDGWVGLFDIVTHPDHRNRGHGMELVRSLLAWAKASGARQAYLQVVATNLPALGLYENLGFRERYTYWYRARRA